MDDETSSRIRDLIIDIGRRQRSSQPDAQAAIRRMLASTLRLAGHTVSENRGDSAGPGATPQPEEAADDDNTIRSEDAPSANEASLSDKAALSDSTEQPAAETPTRERRPDGPALRPRSHAASQDPEEFSGPDATALQDETAQIDGSAQQDDALSFDDALQTDEALETDDALQIDDSAQADGIGETAQIDDALQIDDSAHADELGERAHVDGTAPQDDTAQEDDTAQSNGTLLVDDSLPPDDALQIDDSAESGDSVPPDASDSSGDLLLVDDPGSPFDPDSDLSADDSTLSIEPAGRGTAHAWLEPQSMPTALGLPVSPAGSAGSLSAVDSPPGDLPPDSDSSIVLVGDSASFHRPPAPGIKLPFPSPGAGALSDASADSGGSNAEGGDGGPPNFGGGATSGGDQTHAERPKIIVQSTAMLTEQLIKAAAERVLPLAQKTVDAAISDLRNDIYVSRAARNALFPR